MYFVRGESDVLSMYENFEVSALKRVSYVVITFFTGAVCWSSGTLKSYTAISPDRCPNFLEKSSHVYISAIFSV